MSFLKLLAATAAVCALATGALAQAPPALDLTLRPHQSAGEVDFVEITLKLEAPNARPGENFLRLPMVFASVETARYEAKEIEVVDAQGEVPLIQKDDAADPANFMYFRRWQVSRPTKGDVTVRYKAPARAFRPKLGSGPPFDLRPEAGGLNGAGVSFLALPDTPKPYSLHLAWDLAAMPVGSRGAQSLGEGDLRMTGPVELLANTFYMAGPINSYPEPSSGPFAIYWLGTPPFDVQAVASWTEKARTAIASFFGEPDKPYRVFFRKNPYPGTGGAGLINSFMSGFSDDPAPTVESMRHHLAHEIVHNWPGSLSGPNGIVAWYGEGLAEFYSATIPWRAGLITTEDFLAQVNERAQSYYGNPVNTAPASEIAAKFWTDTRVRKLPYDRGAFYMAMVDAQIRAKSGGERRLDDLVKAMLARKQAGQSYDTEAWLDLLDKELGPQARTEFDAMMAGKLLVPPSDAYGPCFRRDSAQFRQFELGFDSASLAGAPRIVKGLVPGSGAERAGLKNGDEITQPVVLDAVQGKPEATITLKVRRGGQDFEITYLPRGEAQQGYRWSRVASVPDSQCAI
jgi:predicted metalloprotease with PDZ domain